MNSDTEEILQKLEMVGFFLRGLWLDPALPKRIKEVLEVKFNEIDAFVSERSDR
jgi:hypothetical protein